MVSEPSIAKAGRRHPLLSEQTKNILVIAIGMALSSEHLSTICDVQTCSAESKLLGYRWLFLVTYLLQPGGKTHPLVS